MYFIMFWKTISIFYYAFLFMFKLTFVSFLLKYVCVEMYIKEIHVYSKGFLFIMQLIPKNSGSKICSSNRCIKNDDWFQEHF